MNGAGSRQPKCALNNGNDWMAEIYEHWTPRPCGAHRRAGVLVPD